MKAKASSLEEEEEGYVEKQQQNDMNKKEKILDDYLSFLKRKKKSIQFLWISFLLISTSLCVYMIIKSVLEYLEFEVITKIRVFNERPMEFPRVMICNKNPFVTKEANSFLNKFVIKSQVFNITTNESVLITNMLEAGLNAKNPEYGNENRKLLGYPIDEMLIRCHFQEIKCTADDFIWHYDFNYGNCFIFNSGYNKTGHKVPIRKVQKPGRFSGLYLQLFIGKPQDQYLSEFSAGIHVVISNSSITPSPSEGINARPGSITNIDINKVITKRMPKPYSDCEDLSEIDTGSSETSVLFNTILKSNYSYRQKDCFELCLQKTIIEKCECYDLQYPMLFNSKPCLNQSEIECTEKLYYEFIENDYINKKCIQYCPLECDSVSYQLSTSTSTYPTEIYAKILMTRPQIQKYFANETITYEKLRETLVALDINYADLKYTIISEIASRTLIDLVASIGGTISLFLGTSLMSLVEVFEKMVNIVIIFKNRSF
jgi:hypothetical protein